MVRWGMVAAAAAVVAGAAFVTGSSVPSAPGLAAGAKPPRGGSRVGYVNLPRIHREYRKAAKLAGDLTAARKEAQDRVEALKVKALDARMALEAARDAGEREQRAAELAALTRQAEDATAAGTRQTTTRAEAALKELFADIRVVVGQVARENGLDAVHAFPGDPETDKPAEIEYILKTPALAPLYLDPAADLTDRVLRRLNDRFEAGAE